MPKKKIGKLGRIRKSIWLFPCLLLILLMLLTVFKISGSSVGMYYSNLYGGSSHDPDLIYGHPRGIRSDEWLVGTQLTISQSLNGYQRVNQDMIHGQDLSLLSEVQSKDWSTVFKPQNWIYFVLPLEYAFAFKWWLIMFFLMISCYFFVLRILPGQKLVAAIIGTAIGLSPFELWWYQSSAFLPVAYGFLMLVLLIRIVNDEQVRFIQNKRLGIALYVSGLAFLLSCFGLILYPPFQIPIILIVISFGAGYILQARSKLNSRDLLHRLGIIILGVMIAAFVGFSFIATHRATIRAINSSIYPGHRLTQSGDLKLLNVFDAFLMPAEQSDRRGGHFITNQSEASNFILLMPFLLLPGLALIARDRRLSKPVDWALFGVILICLLFLIRAFVPTGSSLFKLLLLQRVPNGRLIIGMGFAGIILMVCLMKKIAESKIPDRRLLRFALLYGLGCFAVLLWAGIYVREHYPLFMHNLGLISLFALAFTAIIVALLSNRRTWAAVIFLGFTILSSFRILPLYHGLGILAHGQIIKSMKRISAPHDSWVTVGEDASTYENFGLVAGRRSLSGTQLYPNLKFWGQVAGPSYKSVYDREGHVFFTDNPSVTTPFTLLQRDAFLVRFDCSSNFIKQNAQFALSVHRLTESCVSLVDTVKYPATTFYLYRISQ